MATDYVNPAKLFLIDHTVESLASVIEYTDFLRVEAELTSTPPINLQKIIDHFGMHTPKAIDLPQQEGATIPFQGIPQIIFHSGDIPTRQRFTIAHELIELLISELSTGVRADRIKKTIFGINSEQICQKGSASLLMPHESFFPRALRLGLSFQTAEILADEYDVSLMAALCRLTDMFPKQAIMILWQLSNKPTEIKKTVPEQQLALPGIQPTNLPAAKLRVVWKYGKYKTYFMPKDKSIPEDSSVYEAWKENHYTSGEEYIPFGNYNAKTVIENKPIIINDEKSVLSLVR